MKILLLEDNADDKELLLKHLESTPLNFELQLANTEASYIDVLKNFNPDIIICDYNIQGYNVIEALQMARKQDPFIPFIIISGANDHDEALTLITDHNVNDYVLKDNYSRLYHSIIRECKTARNRNELNEARNTISDQIAEQQNLREKIESQLNRLKRAQEFAKLGEWSYEHSNKIITWSDYLFELYDRDKTLGAPAYEEFISMHDTEDAKIIDESIQEAIQTGNPYDIELTINVSGTKKFIKAIGYPFYDADGNIEGLHGIAQDISDLKRSRLKVQDQEYSLRSIADNIDGVMLQYVLLPDGSDELPYVSDGVERFYERSAQEIMENPAIMWEMIVDEDVAGMQQSILESAKEGVKWDHIWRIKSPLGDLRYMHGMGEPRKQADGTVIWDSLLLDETYKVRLHDELLDRELRLDAAIDGADLGVWDLNLVTGENFINERWWSMLGYAKNEMDYSFEFFDSLLHPEDRKKPVDEIRRIEEGGENLVDIKIRLMHKDGTYRVIQDRGRAVKFDENGKIVRMVGTHMDITEQVQMQEELKENQFRLESAVEGAKLGIWDTKLREDSKFTNDANDRWFEMLGFKADEIDDSFDFLFSRVHPEDANVISEAIKQVEDGDENSFEVVLRLKHKEGHYITILDKGTAIEFDPDGSVSRMIGTHLDITGQIELEEKLKESQFRLETAIDGANLGIWDANIRDKTNIANTRWFEMIGFKPEEVEDSFGFFFSRVHPDDLDHITNEISRIGQGEKNSFEVILRVMHKNGEYITILDKGTALEYDSEGLVTRMIGTHLDITDLVKTNNRLEEALKEKDLLLQEVHHRVKNNLAIVSGLLQLEAFKHDNLPALIDANNRIHSISIVYELLHSSGSLQNIGANDYLNKLTRFVLKSLGSDSKVTLDCEISVEKLNINEAVPIGLLINELMTNSIKHAIEDEGAITCRLYGEEENSRIRHFHYSDSGTGFDPSELNKGSMGLELINTLLENLHAEYTLNVEGQFELNATFEIKEQGAYAHGSIENP